MHPRNSSSKALPVSIFGLPAGWRVAVVMVIIALLWLGVAWALY